MRRTTKKPGYILLILFIILSGCMALITIFFSRSSRYRNLMSEIISNDKTSRLAISGISIGKAILDPIDKDKNEDVAPQKDEKKDKVDGKNQKIFKSIFPFLQASKKYKLIDQVDGVSAEIEFLFSSENGKLNINSLYNIEDEKFVDEGSENDRKKFCIWLFDQIAKITQTESLFEPFFNHIKSRDADLNDVTELLRIKQFEETFKNKIFYKTDPKEEKPLFLTDLFTVSTDQETINPYLFSESWCTILQLRPKAPGSEEEIKKMIASFKDKPNWANDWDDSLSKFYQKDYQDLPKEIKSMLTQECELNIFSLLLSATIGETTSTIFTILDRDSKKESTTFNILKIYQI